MSLFWFYRKPAQLEGLEVDQYIWGILNTLNAAEVEEVTIDSAANWKPAKNLASIKPEEDTECKRVTKAMSPGSMNMPTMNSWDINQAMSPYIPPDMSSIVSGSMMNTTPAYGNINHRNSSGGSYDINPGTTTTTNDYNTGPGSLTHLNESINTMDPLNAMEKSLNDQVCFWRIRWYTPTSTLTLTLTLTFTPTTLTFINVLFYVFVDRCLRPLERRTRRVGPTVAHQVFRHHLRNQRGATTHLATQVQI